MTTAAHERQHDLIEQTLHEIRGDVKWLRESQEQMRSKQEQMRSELTSIKRQQVELRKAQGRMKDQLDHLELTVDGIKQDVTVGVRMIASLAMVSIDTGVSVEKKQNALKLLLKDLQDQVDARA